MRTYFAARETYKTYKASYGLGTWLLGPDRARAKLKKEEESDPRDGSQKDDVRAKLEQKINRYVKNQQANATAVQKAGTEQQGRLRKRHRRLHQGHRTQPGSRQLI